jgi:hypothetical protein
MAKVIILSHKAKILLAAKEHNIMAAVITAHIHK